MSEQDARARRTRGQDENPYFIEVDDNGCGHCGAGRTWCVVGPGGERDSTSFDEEEDAARLADLLNEAYWHGVGTERAR